MQISSFFKQNLIYNNNCKEVKLELVLRRKLLKAFTCMEMIKI